MKNFIISMLSALAFQAYASTECDTQVNELFHYYSAVLPEKIIKLTTDETAELTNIEQKKADTRQVSFYDVCIWRDVINGKEVPEPYRAADRLLMNAESYMVIMRTTSREKELRKITGMYCEFISRGVKDFPTCTANNEL